MEIIILKPITESRGRVPLASKVFSDFISYGSVSQPFVERGTLENFYLFLRNPIGLKYEIFNFSSKYHHHAIFLASKYNIPPLNNGIATF